MIFRREDFILCNVPVAEGYPQSQTHCGVATTNDRLLLTASPYPVPVNTRLCIYTKVALRKLTCGLLFPPGKPADSYENPFIYVGEGVLGANPITNFKLIRTKPLMDTPDPYNGIPAFNSDPDIFIEKDHIYVLNRVFVSITPDRDYYSGYKVLLYLIEGVLENMSFKLKKILLLKEFSNKQVASPCLFKKDGLYRLVQIDTNSYNDGITFNGIYLLEGKSIDDLRESNNWHILKLYKPDELLPWHMSVFQENGKFYSIVSCVKRGQKERCWQMIGSFNESLTELRISDIPLTDYKSYRSSAYVKDDLFYLYNTTVNEKIDGSTSVDGRDILVACKSFRDVKLQAGLT